ncbi:MAG: GHKL domain-containing protein [Blautia sp.]|nr:GHKL domain-containing protein [Blautia sp.]
MIWYVLGGIVLLAVAVTGGRYYMIRLVDRRISRYQNDLLEKHCEEVENMYRQTRGWRHDYHNHIQTMKAYLSMGELDKLEEYLGELDADLTTVDTVVKTGNVMIDAALNSKISLARARNIAVDAKAIVPRALPVPEVDFSLIIGNLMDNAMEACMKIGDETKRFIRVYIDILKGQLYIYIINSTEGRVKGKVALAGKKIRYLSGKDSRSHGFGLMRVDRVVERYQGYIDRQDEENVFVTEVMLPLVHE